MIIDILTQRYTFSDKGTLLPLFFYAGAAVIALLLRRWGQFRGAKKASGRTVSLRSLILRDVPSGIWYVFFFVLTGCLKGPFREEEKAEDATVNRKCFVSGTLFVLYGWIASTVACLFLNGAESTFFGILFLITRALSIAHGSLLIFSLLPLPCSDIETLFIQPDLGDKGLAFRKNGTFPFFLFTALALLLAVIVVAVAGRVYSLIGIATMFPLMLIGG